jgi:HAD superfamily hydrolase (TIGR01549 family)
MIKFDLIIMNPPYERDLHLKILEEAISNHLKDDKNSVCVNLSPVVKSTSIRNLYDEKTITKHKKFSILKYLKDVEVIKSSDNKLFNDANIQQKIGIQTYSLNNKSNEIDLELEYCYANSYMLEVFNILKENNKTIIATSDMYLPKEIIEKILLKNGFNGFDKIFVSNEYKCNKGDGKLFNIVKKMYKNKKFIHIGDNYFADVLGAKKVKIDSYYYQR